MDEFGLVSVRGLIDWMEMELKLDPYFHFSVSDSQVNNKWRCKFENNGAAIFFPLVFSMVVCSKNFYTTLF